APAPARPAARAGHRRPTPADARGRGRDRSRHLLPTTPAAEATAPKQEESTPPPPQAKPGALGFKAGAKAPGRKK
ncbi:hypothetical protein, partial [Prescottella equi]|uniref:hypothetical protein n=1 Tax=Rhodococcus hoagii TaxID=43767 RepID=UPI0012F8A026